jgi:hypothetical protein
MFKAKRKINYNKHCSDMLIIESSHSILLTNVLNYFSSFDGTCKAIADVSHLFQSVYSDDFIYQVDSNPHYYNYNQMKQVQSNFLALGSKATLLLFKDITHNQIEYKFRMENDLLDVVIHNVVTVKDDKFVKIHYHLIHYHLIQCQRSET